MAEPATKEEYEARFAQNQRVSGFGIQGVRVHLPCPFCGAADNLVHAILDTESATSKGAVCPECARGWRAVYRKAPGIVSFTFVQTCGPDPAPWIAPSMPRDTEVLP